MTSPLIQNLTASAKSLVYKVVLDKIEPPLIPDPCDRSIIKQNSLCLYFAEEIDKINYIFKDNIDTVGQAYVKITSQDYDPVIFKKIKACAIDSASAVTDLFIKASDGDDRTSTADRLPYSLFEANAGKGVSVSLTASNLRTSAKNLLQTSWKPFVDKCVRPSPSPSSDPTSESQNAHAKRGAWRVESSLKGCQLSVC